MDILKRINFTAIVVALIVGIAIASYGYLNYRNKQNQLAFEKQKQQAEILERKMEEANKLVQGERYESCLGLAYDDYKKNWDIRVRDSGRNDNLLPNYLSDDLEIEYKAAQELCIKKYK